MAVDCKIVIFQDRIVAKDTAQTPKRLIKPGASSVFPIFKEKNEQTTTIDNQ
jgi:hypothetical protein